MKQNFETLYPDLCRLEVAPERDFCVDVLADCGTPHPKPSLAESFRILMFAVFFRRRSVLTKKLFLAVITLLLAVCNIAPGLGFT